MSEQRLELEYIDGRYAVCRFEPGDAIPPWAEESSGLMSITRTEAELSIVAHERVVPECLKAERGFVALRVAGVLDFSLVGVLSKLTGALAEAGVPVLAISTHDTDVLLIRAEVVERAVAALAGVADVS
jgi:hypothetical protein